MRIDEACGSWAFFIRMGWICPRCACRGRLVALIAAAYLAACRSQAALRPLDRYSSSAGLPKLSAIAAAKNESDCIETCIRSLFRQDYPDLEVVAINDRSSDDTGAIAGSARHGVRRTPAGRACLDALPTRLVRHNPTLWSRV